MIIIVDILAVYNFRFSPECTYIFNINLRICFLELLGWDLSTGEIKWVKHGHFPKHHEYLPAFARDCVVQVFVLICYAEDVVIVSLPYAGALCFSQ
jgi:hypothetical protein